MKDHSQCGGEILTIDATVEGPNILDDIVTAQVKRKQCLVCGYVETIKLIKGDPRYAEVQ